MMLLVYPVRLAPSVPPGYCPLLVRMLPSNGIDASGRGSSAVRDLAAGLRPRSAGSWLACGPVPGRHAARFLAGVRPGSWLSCRIRTTAHASRRPGPYPLPANDMDAPSMSRLRNGCSINAVSAPHKANRTRQANTTSTNSTTRPASSTLVAEEI
jgi:hypothetical protein